MQSGESVLVGRFSGAWGVQGWVKVFSYTHPPTSIFDYRPWRLGEHGQTLDIEHWQQSGRRLLVKLCGIDSPEQAAALGQAEIVVPRSSLPAAEPGTWYWHDLTGLEVVNLEGHRYGRIDRMLETGANDVMEVADGEDRVLIPFVIDTFVHSVDLDAGRVTVDWPVEWAE